MSGGCASDICVTHVTSVTFSSAGTDTETLALALMFFRNELKSLHLGMSRRGDGR